MDEQEKMDNTVHELLEDGLSEDEIRAVMFTALARRFPEREP